MKKVYYIKDIKTGLALDWYSGSYFFGLVDSLRNGTFDSELEAVEFLSNDHHRESIIDDLGNVKIVIDYYIELI